MTRQLGDGAACAKQGTAAIFTSMAALFWDAVPSTSILTSLAKGIAGPDGEEERTKGLEDRDKWRNGVNIVWHAVDFEHGTVDKVAADDCHNNVEGVPRGHERAGFTQPSELQTHHHLSHQNLGANERTHDVRVARRAWAGSAASTQGVFPRSSWNIQARTLECVFEWGEEHLTFLDATFRLR